MHICYIYMHTKSLVIQTNGSRDIAFKTDQTYKQHIGIDQVEKNLDIIQVDESAQLWNQLKILCGSWMRAQAIHTAAAIYWTWYTIILISSNRKGYCEFFAVWYNNPSPAKLIYSNFHPLEIVSRYRDPQLQVAENSSHFFNFCTNICKSWCLDTHFIPNNRFDRQIKKTD